MPYKDIMKRVLGEDLPEFSNHLMNNRDNDFWQSDPRYNVIDSIDFPVLFTDGWYDYYTLGMFSMWSRLSNETKAKSAFVVGPWGHDTKVKEETEYPLPNGNIPSDYSVRWFNSIREGKKYELAELGKVNYYSVGADQWKTNDFPYNATETKRLYFAENGRLSDCSSGGSVTYEYDPEKRNNAYKYLNIYKAEKINTIDGICSFVSEPFEFDESFFGNIRWYMTVSSDCEESAFFIRVFLEENGEAYNLTETITSINHLNPDYKPYEKLIIDLKTPPIGFTVKKGSKIRVDISSDGGIFVPSANVKGHFAEVTQTKVANNTVYFENSFIELNKA